MAENKQISNIALEYICTKKKKFEEKYIFGK